jgi:hypothetical protein
VEAFSNYLQYGTPARRLGGVGLRAPIIYIAFNMESPI